jgi:cell division protein FtsZ
MTLNLSTPRNTHEIAPRITVIGVGGAGGNAVNNMIRSNLEGVEFMVTNTDAQALAQSICDRRIQLGLNITQGLGAGSRPDIGRAAAEEALELIISELQGSNMVFITAGMGGGTGTGAAPVIARAAREHGILTVGVVTKPFHFEGTHRMRLAESGITELQQYVDTLIIIPNQNLFRVANEKTTFADAFAMADQVLHSGVRGVTDLMVMPGLINLDFADIRTVMSEMGKAMMGTGEAEGENRAVAAAEAAISNPLLDDVSMKGARGVLINITGGFDMTLFEVDEAANRIRDEVDPEANIIFGSTFDRELEGRVRISVVATGIEAEAMAQPRPSLTLVAKGGRMINGSPVSEAPTIQPAPQPMVMQAREMRVQEPMMPAYTAQAAVNMQPQPSYAPQPQPQAQPRMQPMQPQVQASQPAPQPVYAQAPEMRPAPQPRIDVRQLPTTEELPFSAPAHAPHPHTQIPVQAPPAYSQAPVMQQPPVMAPAPQYHAEPAPQPAPQPQYQPPAHIPASMAEPAAKRSGGLFHRMTSTAASWAQKTTQDLRTATPAAAMNRVSAGEPGVQRPIQQPAPQAAQPRLSGLDPADRLAQRSGDDEILDIPAFLRRQAN